MKKRAFCDACKALSRKTNQNSHKTPQLNFAYKIKIYIMCQSWERSYSKTAPLKWTIYCFREFFINSIIFFSLFFFSHRDGENYETSCNGLRSSKHTKSKDIHGFSSPVIKGISRRDPTKEPFSRNCVPKKSSAFMWVIKIPTKFIAFFSSASCSKKAKSDFF